MVSKQMNDVIWKVNELHGDEKAQELILFLYVLDILQHITLRIH